MEKLAARFALLAVAISIVIVHCEAGKMSLDAYIKIHTLISSSTFNGMNYEKLIFYDIACKDSYPKNYWKRCSVTCTKLKARGACRKKWNQVLTGNCKRVVPAWHRNRYVNQYCKKSCGGCSKKKYNKYICIYEINKMI